MNFVKELLIDIYNQRKLDNHEFIYKEEILKYKNSHLNHFFGKYKIWKDVPKNPSSTCTNSLSKNIKNNIIFGLKSGVVFYEKGVVFLTKNTKYSKHVFSPYSHINLFHFLKITDKNLTINSKYKKLDSYPTQDYMVEKNIPLSSFDHNFLSSWLELLKERFKIENERKLKSEQLRKIEFQKKERKDLGIPTGMIVGELLIKIEVRDLFGRNLEIKLCNNRLETKYKGKVASHEEHTEVHYFDRIEHNAYGNVVKFPLSEFSNMRIETGNLNGVINGKPCLSISVKQIFELDGSGGQKVLDRLKDIDPAEKKKLKKVIFYFENFKNVVEIKDLERLFLESEKNEIDLIENTLKELDKDNNGIIDIIEINDDFNQLLKKHQKIIIEKSKDFNQNYNHDFIKVGNYLKQKRNNIQLIFNCLKQVNGIEFNEFLQILKNDIYSYNLLLINSLNLIVSLIEDDQLTFYDIYENFDKLNIYNSNWENEISQKLTTLNKGISELNKGISELNSNIKGLMYEIRDMGDKIVDSIGGLSYITEKTNMLLDRRLGEIDSTLKVGNLINVINAYQNYKINKNTKSLKG